MLNKIIISLVLILMLLGAGIYFRIEFKYMMVLTSQNSIILNKIKKASTVKYDEVNTAEDSIAQIAEQNGIAFGVDFELYDKNILKVCAADCLNRISFYRSYIKIIDQINIEELWVFSQNKTKDRVATYILEREKNKILNTLKKTRQFISDQYQKIDDNNLKQQALDLVKKIDLKILDLNKK